MIRGRLSGVLSCAGDLMQTCLFILFCLAFASTFSLSAAKPTQNGAFFCVATQARMSGFSSNSSVGVRPFSFLSFLPEIFFAFQSATAATEMKTSLAFTADFTASNICAALNSMRTDFWTSATARRDGLMR